MHDADSDHHTTTAAVDVVECTWTKACRRPAVHVVAKAVTPRLTRSFLACDVHTVAARQQGYEVRPADGNDPASDPAART